MTTHAWSDSVLFTRQQVSELAGVSDGVLSFWIKNNLLISSEGGEGRGSHRKFAPIQVSFAAILGKLQQFGLNISSLRGFAELLQRGATLCEGTQLHPYSLLRAARFAEQLASVERGETVRAYRSTQSTVNNDCGVEIIEEASEDDLIAELRDEIPDHDPYEYILEFARKISGADYDVIEMYSEIRAEMEAVDIADFAWLLWQDDGGEWKVAHQSEPDSQFSGHPEVETAIYLAVGKIVRRVWKLNLEERKQTRRIRGLASLRRHNPALAARLEELDKK